MQIRHLTKLLIALMILIIPAISFAASVTLRWQANQEPDISNYNVYYGTQSRDYGLPIPAGNSTSYTVDNLTEGTTYYFALTAVDTSGNESGYSSEVVANATSSEPATEDYQLLLSYNSNRSNAVKLDEQTISGNVYIFLDPEANVSQVVFSIDGQTHNTENYAPYDLGVPFDSSRLSNGSHTISALIRHQDASTQTISSTCTVQNEQASTPEPTVPPASLSLITDVSSPATGGDIVQLTAQAVGGTNLEYMFMIYDGSWSVLQDYSSDNTYTWDTSGYSGTYRLQAYVRNTGTTGTYISSIAGYDKYARISNFIVSGQPASPQPVPDSTPPSSLSLITDVSSPATSGDIVQLTAQAVGGTNLEYMFMIYDGSWSVLQDYSSDNTYTWDTSGYSGTYRLQAYVRNIGTTGTYISSIAGYDKYARISNFIVSGQPASPQPVPDSTPPSSLSLITDVSSPATGGDIVQLTAQAVGGTNLEYMFMIYDGSWSVLQDYSSDNTYTWDTSGYSGTYRLQAYVRNTGTTGTYISSIAGYDKYARISNFIVNSTR